MSPEGTPKDPPHAYRRWIEGSGLSLEANTTSTPSPNVFYVLQEGVVCFSSRTLGVAREEFNRLRGAFWETLLRSPDPQQRLAGARGLLRSDPSHGGALKVLAADGDKDDLRHLARARDRAIRDARRLAGPGAAG